METSRASRRQPPTTFGRAARRCLVRTRARGLGSWNPRRARRAESRRASPSRAIVHHKMAVATIPGRHRARTRCRPGDCETRSRARSRTPGQVRRAKPMRSIAAARPAPGVQRRRSPAWSSLRQILRLPPSLESSGGRSTTPSPCTKLPANSRHKRRLFHEDSKAESRSPPSSRPTPPRSTIPCARGALLLTSQTRPARNPASRAGQTERRRAGRFSSPKSIEYARMIPHRLIQSPGQAPDSVEARSFRRTTWALRSPPARGE